jgi:choice-of-anchor C domain-containing protein
LDQRPKSILRFTMDWKIFKTIAYCYRAVSQNYWVNRALETYDAVFLAMTDLRMPKDPNKPDIVELESRILYSASPFSMWNGLDVAPEPNSPWDCPPGMDQEDWDTQLLAFSEYAKDPDLVHRTDAIRSARGLNASDNTDNSDSDNDDSDYSDSESNVSDSSSVAQRLDEQLDRMEKLLAGLEDPDNTRIVLHGTDSTARLGHSWIRYGYATHSSAELAIHQPLLDMGMRIDPDGSIQSYGCDVFSDRGATLLQTIAASVAAHLQNTPAIDEVSAIIGSNPDEPQRSLWSLDSHLNEIESLNTWNLHLHTHMDGLLARYACLPQPIADPIFDSHTISTWELPEDAWSQSEQIQLAPNSDVILLLDVPTGLNICVVVQPERQATVHALSTGFPMAMIDAENATQFSLGRNIPSAENPCDTTPFNRMSPSNSKLLTANGCIIGVTAYWLHRPQETFSESMGSREIDNQGLADASAETLSILEPIVEQLTSTVPTLQSPIPTDSNSLAANAAPEQLGQLFYTETEQLGQLFYTETEQLGQLFYTEDSQAGSLGYNEIAFIQAGLVDSDALIADIETNALATGRDLTIVILNGTENGFDQINSVLAQYQNLDAIHIVSHGTDGMIQLGGSWLTAGNVQQHFTDLQQWGMSLSESGDILIYGCDVAAGPEGQALIDTVARLTGADVAASTDKTGDVSRGGDWTLEYIASSTIVERLSSTVHELPNSQTVEDNCSTIGAHNPFSFTLQQSYGGLLATYTVTNTLDSGAGSLRQAILDANANAGDDTIVFNITGATGFVGTSGVDGRYVLNLTSALPSIDGALTIDATTQTTNQGNTNVGVLGTGGIVGTDGLTLSQVNRSEIEIFGTGSIATGFDINASNVTIRGLSLRTFSSEAILVRDTFSGIVIEQNIIGSSSTSLTDPGSGNRLGYGIRSIGADSVTVQNNLIGYADFTGINISAASNSWTIQNNEIVDVGINFSNADGIAVGGSNSTLIRGNRITGTSTQAVIVSGGSASTTIENNTFMGNGVGPSGGAVVQSDAIAFRSGITSGTVYRNIIADNYGAGITLNNGASGIVISQNSIYGNGTILARDGSAATGQIGIDLMSSTDNTGFGTAPFFTLNDSGDGDSGGNDLLNFPVLTSAVTTSAGTTIVGSLNSNINTTLRIEFFSTPDGLQDASGYGEGRRYLGTVDVTTNGTTGDANFNTLLSGIVLTGRDRVTATARNLTTNSTSEFGLNVQAQANWYLGTSGNDTMTGSGGADVLYDGVNIAADGQFMQGSAGTSYTGYSNGQSFGGWTVSSGNVDLIGDLWTRSPSGGRSVDLDGVTPGAISQTLTTVAGNTYQVRFVMSANANGVATRALEVSAAGVTQNFSTTTPSTQSYSSMDWQERFFTFTATTSSTTLNFRSLSASGGAGPVLADVVVADLTANNGSDVLSGASGNDTILGGGGNDTLTGGASTNSNRVVNGDFETHSTPNNDFRFIYAPSSLPGWTINAGAAIEHWNNLAGYGFSGGVVELDAAAAVDGFYQEVSTTIGEQLTLSYDVGRRSGASAATSTVLVYWRGQLVESYDPTQDSLVTRTINVVGSGGLDRLEFREEASDTADQIGAVLDNITLTARDDDTILGGAGNDTIDGGAGNDTITGGADNDAITGGVGTDIVIYSGNRSDYSVTLASGTYTLTDLRTGSADGTDTVTGVETFRFADGDLSSAMVALNTPIFENFDNGSLTGWTGGAIITSNADFGPFLTSATTGNSPNTAPATLGVYNTQDVYKTFSLSGNQTSVTISFTFNRIDTWDNEAFKVWANDTLVSNNNYLLSSVQDYNDGTPDLAAGTNYGFLSFDDVTYTLVLTVNTTGTSLKLGFGSALDESWNNESWGVDNILIREQASGTTGAYSEGTTGNDSNTGTSLSDSYAANTGNDTINSGAGRDLASGGDGADTIDGGENLDVILGGWGADTLAGGLGSDTIDGGVGDDTLYGGGVNLIANGTFENGATNWTTSGNLGVGTPEGGTVGGNSMMFNGGGTTPNGIVSQTVTTAVGSTYTLGFDLGAYGASSSQSMLVEIISGGFTIFSQTYNDTGSAPTTFDSYELAFTAIGTSTQIRFTDVSLSGNSPSTDVVLDNVRLFLDDSGADTIYGGNGADLIYGGFGNDTIVGGVGSDTMFGGDGTDTLSYIGSTVAVTVNLATRSASGGDADGDTFWGFENLTGSAFNDYLIGDSGNNRIFAEVGDYDVIVGGGGADYLDGGTGIWDRIDYRTSVSAVSLNFLTNTFSGGDAGDDTLVNIEGILGTSGNDTMIAGNTTGYWFFGYDGVDTLTGGIFGDWFVGGAGADILDGGAGSDTLQYSESLSAVYVNIAANFATGGEATGDSFVNFENVYASNFDDTLLGDNGDNIFYGVDGNDVMLGLGGADSFYGGNGTDIVILRGNSTDYTLTWNSSAVRYDVVGPDGTDYLFNIEHIVFDDLVLTLDGLGGSATTAAGSYAGGRLQVGTSSGSTINPTTALVVYAGMGGNDVFNGSSGNDFLIGGDGDDAIYGEQAVNANVTDYLSGGSGNDYIEGFSGADILSGGAGASDTLGYFYSTSGVTVNLATSTASGGDATGDTFSGFENMVGSGYDDSLTGDSQNNTIYGLAGNDVLDGGAGTDTLSYGSASAGIAINLGVTTAQVTGGEGTDTISNFENVTGSAFGDSLIGSSNANVIDAGGGDDIIFARGGNDSIIGGAGTDIALFTGNRSAYTITWDAGNSRYNVVGTDGSDTVATVEHLVFEDEVLTLDNVGGFSTTAAGTYASGRLVVGTSSADSVTLANTGVVYAALAGQDSITGGTGADFIWGGGGNDTLQGGAGADILNAGTDGGWITYASSSSAVTANLSTGVGSGGDAAGDLIVNTLWVMGSAFGDTLTGDANNNWIGGLGGADVIDGVGGTDYADYVLSSSGVNINLLTNINTGGDAQGDMLYNIENIRGSILADSITGDGGNNVLSAGSGNDTVDGGAGNDTLSGEGGNDTIIGGIGTDTVVFSGNRSDYSVSYNATLQSYTILDLRSGSPNGTDVVTTVENFQFADGTRTEAALIDDASTISIPTSITATEDTNVVFSTGNGNAITVGDPDGVNQQITLSVPNGRLTLASVTGLTFTSGDGTNDELMTFSGSIANINTALNGLTFAPTSDFNGATSIRVVSRDATQSSALDTDASLLIRYTFDNTSQLNDDTATTANGTLLGVVSASDSFRGNVASFDGVDDVITTANFNTPSTFSIGTWAKSDTATWNTDGMLLSKRDSFVLHPHAGSNSITIYVRNTSLVWTTASINLSTISNFSITDWHHYGASFDGTTVKLFVDGVERASTVFSGTLLADSGPMTIGQDDGSPGSRNFDGNMDDARLYSRALSAGEFATLAANSSAVREQTFNITAANDAPTVVPLTAGNLAISFDSAGTLAQSTSGTSVFSTSGTVNFATDGTRGGTIQLGTNGIATIDSEDRPTLGAEWTLSTRFKDLQFENTNWLTLFRGVSEHQLIIDRSSGSLGYYDNDTNGQFISSGYNAFALDDNNWHTATVTRATSGTLTYYIDGTAVGTLTDTTSSTTLQWYGNYSSGDQAFAQYLDDFRFFDKALTAGQIAAIHSDAEATISLAENSANGTVVETVTVRDPDAGATATYSLTNSAAGRFAIDSSTGVITVAKGYSLDFESQTSHVITVRATDNTGLTNDRNITINITNVNEAPVSIESATILRFSDDFNDGDLNGWTPISLGNATYNWAATGGGAFELSDAGVGFLSTSVVGQTTATEYTLRADVWAASDGAFNDGVGFVFGYVDGNNYWLARWVNMGDTASGFSTFRDIEIVRVASGTSTQMAKVDAVNLPSNLTMELQASSGVLRLLVNGVEQVNVSTTIPALGTFGLYTADSDSGIRYDNVRLETGRLAVSENSSNGTVVGSIAGVDRDASSSFTYSLANDAGGRFAINSSTGQITVANGSLLNFEAAYSHDVTVRVSDGLLTYDRVFRIDLTNVNENSTDILIAGPGSNLLTNGSFESGNTGWTITGNAGWGNAFAESDGTQQMHFNGGGQTPNGVVSQAITTVVGQTYTVMFDLGSHGTGVMQAMRFEAIGSSTLATSDLESISAATADHRTFTYTFTANSTSTTIRFTDLSEAALSASTDMLLDNVRLYDTPSTLSIAENAAAGTVVGRVGGSDLDPNDDLTYAIVAGATNDFEIVGNEIRVKAGATLDFEATTSKSVTVRVTDEGGLTYDKVLTINLTNVNEGPTIGNVLLDNVTFGGQSSVTTMGASNRFGDRSIAVDTTGTYAIYVTASSNGASATHYAGYDTTDIDGYHIGPENYLQSSSAADTQLAQALNPGDTQIVVSNASSWYNGSSGWGRNFVFGDYSDSTGVNYGVGYSRNLSAGGVNGTWAQNGITGNVITLSSAWVGPALTVGTNLRNINYGGNYQYNVLVAQTIAASPTLYSSTVSGTNDPNEFNYTEFRPGTQFIKGMFLSNYTNGAGVTTTWSNMTIEATGTKLSAVENSAAGTLIGTVRATDVDAGDVLTYSLQDSAGGRFVINSSTGAITVVANDSLDRETAATHSITVRVSDASNSFVDRVYSVEVKDVNESPTNTGVVGTTNLISNSSIETNATGWTTSGNALRLDAIGLGVNTSDGSFGWNFSGYGQPNDGVVQTTIATTVGQAYTISYDVGAYGIFTSQMLKAEAIGTTTLATDFARDVGSNPTTFTRQYFSFIADSTTTTLRFSDVSTVTGGVDLWLDNVQAHALTTTSPTANVAENAANGTVVASVSAIDADVYGTSTYSLFDNAGGRFAVNAVSGQITVANGSLLDLETSASHTVVVRTTDQAGATFDKTVTINLTNVNEAPTDLFLGTSFDGTAGPIISAASTVAVTNTFSLELRVSPQETIQLPTQSTTGASGLSGQHYAIFPDQGQTIWGSNTDAGVGVSVGTNGIAVFEHSGGHMPALLVYTGTINADTHISVVFDQGTPKLYLNGVLAATGLTSTKTIHPSIGAVTGWGLGGGSCGNFKGEISDYRVWGAALSVEAIAINAASGIAAGEPNLLYQAAVSSLNENAANGTVVATIKTVDPDASDTRSYALLNDAGGRFALNTSTGVVTVANSSLLDYETARQHTIQVRVTDSGGLQYTETLTIRLSNANEISSDTIIVRNLAITNSGFEQQVMSDGAFTGTAPGWTVGIGGGFEGDWNPPTVSFAAVPEGTQVAYTNGLGSLSQVLTETLNTSSVYRMSVDVGSRADYPPNVTYAIRLYAGTTLLAETIGLPPSQGGWTTAQITFDSSTLAPGSPLFGQQLKIQLAGVGSGMGNFQQISYDNVQMSVAEPATTTLSVAENSSNGAQVGFVVAQDSDRFDDRSYTLTNDAGGRFAIDNNTGRITVANGSLLNFESTTSHSITVRVTDSAGNIFNKSLTINLTDVNEGPVAVLDTATAAEAGGAANGTAGTNPTGNVLTNDTDIDTGDNKTVSGVLAGVQASATSNVGSAVVGSFGSINIAADGSYTYTVNNANAAVQALRTSSDTITDVFTYTMQDAGGSTSTTQITVTIQGANDTPHDMATTSLTVAESAANTTYVGTITRSDVDASDTPTYSLVDSAGGRFAINSSTGVVTVANSSLLNYEAATNHNITVRVTDLSGAIYDEVFSIALTDVNEFSVTAPVDNNAAANAVDENAALGTVVGVQASAVDSDATTNTVTYSLFDSDSGNFAIDTNTGVVTTAAALDREALGASRSITVRATSADGSTNDTVFTIIINDLDEFNVGSITDTNAAANSLAENSANGTSVGVQASAADADATTNAITYSLDDNAGGRFAINGSTGIVTVLDGSLLNYEAATSHTITVKATSADGSTSTQNYTINLTDVNESGVSAVSDSNAAANTVLENSSNGATVGLTGLATDADGTDTVSYSLDDNAGGRFTINSTTGIVTVSGTLDREAAASYNIIIRATSSDTSATTQTFAINLGDVNEFNVGTVTDSNAAANSVAENAAIGTVVGVQASAVDSDATTNTVAYSLFNSDGGNFAIDSNTGVVTTAAALDREALGASRSITVRATSADGSTNDTVFTISITDLDEFNVGAITDSNAAANTLAENSANGTVVEIQALAADADATTNAITYTLDDNAGGRFTINSSTGVVTVLDGGLLNYELATSHVITVKATSADGSISNQNFTVNLTDVNESAASAINDTNGATDFVLENATVGTVVGITSFASDADATDSISYSLDDNDTGRFAIHATTGVVTVVGAIDREADGATRTITVRATSTDGSFTTRNFTIAIGDVNEFATSSVTDSVPSVNSVAENATVGTTVNLTAFASDADATTNTITYTLFDNDGGRFAINGSTGVVTVAGAINREADGATRTITVRATSADGSHTDQNFTINITDVNEFGVTAPTDTEATVNAVDENVAIGTVVGVQALAADADATTNTITYSLDDNAGGRFTINGRLLDFESATSHTITVKATSADGSTSTQNFTINLRDINEGAISSISDSDTASDFVLENTSIGTVVGVQALAADPDGTDVVTFSLDDNAGGRFAIDTNTGVVTVNGAIDREAAASHNITVRATSSDTSTTTQTFTINLGDVNEFNVGAVTDSNAAANSVAENAAIGTVVGVQASAVDSDATTNTVTYSLFDSDGGRFAIDTNTGIVTVAGAINREADGATRNITIRATSADASFTDQVFAIAINDANEFAVTAPMDVNATANAVDENAAIGTVVGVQASAVDSDATTNTVTYSLFNSDGGNFAIDSNTGVVTTAAALDREALGTSRSITVRATSADGSTNDTVFTISINDLDEFNVGSITDTNAAANSLAENSANGTTVGIVASASDADATTNAIAYSLDDNAGGRFTINSSTGIVTVLDGSLLNYELAISHSITVKATSADGSTSTQNYTIQLTDVNEVGISSVTDNNGAANTVLENSIIGTTVGVTGLATDPDGTDTVSYTLDDSAGGRFAINSSTGVVTVAGAIDREASASYSISIRATSSDTTTTTQSFTINVGDVNEFATSSVTDSVPSVNSVVENATIGTTVGITAFASDADATTNTITYTLFDDDGGRFAINSSTGVVTVAGAIDREVDGAMRTVRVRATSADGSVSDETYLINIYDVDEFDVLAIADLDTAPNAVVENSAVGTVVHYQAYFQDADATSNVVSYSLDDDASGRFVIDTTTGVVTVAASTALNYESNASHTISVRALSDDGSSAVIAVSISVLDVAERPVGLSDRYSTSYVDVLQVLGAGVLFNDTDEDGNVLSIQILSGPSNGVLAFATDGRFEYTPLAGFIGEVTFVYRVFDGGLYSDPTTVTIDVLLPSNIIPSGGNGSGGNGSGGNGTSGNGGGGSDSDGTAGPLIPIGAPIENAKSPSATVTDLEAGQGPSVESGNESGKEAANFGLVETRQSHRVNEAGVGQSHRTTRHYEGVWTLSQDSEQTAGLRSREEFAMPRSIMAEDKEERDEASEHSPIALNMGTVVTTVLGTGVILWVVQATQLAATFITAAAPTWIHVDIASTLDNLAKEKNANDEASAKIFE